MNLLKNFTMTWWQGALFKWGIFALGIAVGAYWHDFFGSYLALLIIFAAILLSYITWVWWRQ